MFSQKETTLLQDLKKAEQLCIEKYSKYSEEASATALQNLFSQIAQKEQQHLQTITQIMDGSVPAMSQGQQSGGGQGQQQKMTSATASEDYAKDSAGYKNDSYLCSDTLAMEKHISAEYNTCIFEFKDTAVRDALNHIQKEEQQHGEMIYNYMASNGMYS